MNDDTILPPIQYAC